MQSYQINNMAFASLLLAHCLNKQVLEKIYHQQQERMLLQVFPQDFYNNPCEGLPDIGFDNNIIQAAVQPSDSVVDVSYIPTQAGLLSMHINFTTPGIHTFLFMDMT